MVQLIKFNHECMHNHYSPNIPKYKSRAKIYFHEKLNFVQFVSSSIRQLYYCDITDCTECQSASVESAAYKKLIKTLENHISSSDYPNLPKFLLFGF